MAMHKRWLVQQTNVDWPDTSALPVDNFSFIMIFLDVHEPIVSCTYVEKLHVTKVLVDVKYWHLIEVCDKHTGKIDKIKRQISSEDYIDLLRYKKLNHRIVMKKRVMFDWHTKRWSVDTYDNGSVVLSALVFDDAYDIHFPPWLTIAHDVSHDKMWSEYAMSHDDWQH